MTSLATQVKTFTYYILSVCTGFVNTLKHSYFLSVDRAMVPGAPPLLCGKISKDIKQELDKLSSDVRMKKLRWFSECFSVSESQHRTLTGLF